MRRKEYIEKLASLIKNRVIFHAPIVYDDELDFDLLEVVGINKNLPIFKFTKPLNKNLYKALKQAQREVSFNLILTHEESVKKSWSKNLKNLYFLDEEVCSYNLLSSINKLNINYLSHSSFSSSINEEYLKVNDEFVNLSFKQFYLYKKLISNGVIFEAKEFILNGKNFYLTFNNPLKQSQACLFEINVPLPNGYYHFSKCKTGIKITNLTSKEVCYFNHNCKGGKLLFSCIDGLESSTRACINLRLEFQLKAHEQKRIYFNFGNNAYLLNSPKEVEDFFTLSQLKAFQKFDVKVSSRDKVFDDKFNNILPQKIWTAWERFSIDQVAEEEYLKIKNKLVKSTNNGYMVNEKMEIKALKIFQNNSYKRVFIVQGEQRYIMAEKTRFFNFTQVSKDFFNKTNEIYLCFGK